MMEVRSTKILGRLTSRLELKLPPATPKFLLSPILFAVTDIEKALRDLKMVVASCNISAGHFFPEALTVPAGKRWHMHLLARASTTGNSYIRLTDGTQVIYLSAVATATLIIYPTGLILDAGWKLGMGQGAAGDTAIDLSAIFEEEDKF